MILNDGWLSEGWKHQGILFIFLTASVAPVWHKQNHHMFLEHQCVLPLLSVKAMSLQIIWIFWMLVFCFLFFYFVCLCGMVWLLTHPKGYIALGQSRWWTRVPNFPTDAQPTSGKVCGSIGQPGTCLNPYNFKRRVFCLRTQDQLDEFRENLQTPVFFKSSACH